MPHPVVFREIENLGDLVFRSHCSPSRPCGPCLPAVCILHTADSISLAPSDLSEHSSRTERIADRYRAEHHPMAEVFTEHDLTAGALSCSHDSGIPEGQRVGRHQVQGGSNQVAVNRMHFEPL